MSCYVKDESILTNRCASNIFNEL